MWFNIYLCKHLKSKVKFKEWKYNTKKQKNKAMWGKGEFPEFPVQAILGFFVIGLFTFVWVLLHFYVIYLKCIMFMCVNISVFVLVI